ncbi:hypothetical protein GCM10025760_21160 [Microbacterium yannicii]|uniref:Glycoside hydrolase family 65 n=1 Tax=Microbacterium yannicii TaxID=671622 RepID=A0ABP9M7I6_9MICO|nr:hypothetical protein [Microbacterium yannicii]MCO5952502.1 hypothetical protein [Microbacterium yannicii]
MTIDRRRLVRRHNPVYTSAHPVAVMTVGNGDIAMSVDVTGLQTFAAFHEIVPDPKRVVADGISGLPEQVLRPFDSDDFQIPLRTQSSWCWYRTRTTRDFRLAQAETVYETSRGPVPYLDRMGLQRAGDPIAEEFEAGAWFHYNPRRAHLGRLALVRPDGQSLRHPSLVSDVRTELDLWSAAVHAEYTLEGERVVVTTLADPTAHAFAVRVESALLTRGWGVAWVFDEQPDELAPFELPLESGTTWTADGPQRGIAERVVESSRYVVRMEATGSLAEGADRVVATARDRSRLEVVVALAPDRARLPATASFEEVGERAERWWRRHWCEGGALSFDGSSDERAQELERRIVLSQYLLAINCAGSTPPAESGLTYNTWTGKFHLEMHWWHAAQFALWGRGHLLERSLGWYHGALERARETAAHQGYRGARWPKQTDPSARESPSNIGVFLVWQQPHLIYLLELLRAEGRDDEFLQRHYPLIEATADFMADFVEERDGRFVLPAPLIPAQESYLADRARTENPTFELAYWSWALRRANEWRARLGLLPRSDWHRIAENMHAPYVLADGTYAAIATTPYLIRTDHPSMLMAAGWLPDTDLIDLAIMRRTLDGVWNDWDLQSSWGWDYAVMAMTAARLGDLSGALDALLHPSPKNVFLSNGHNPQMPGFLTIYLPANGGILAAAAHVAAAVQSGQRLPDGWSIEAEGLEIWRRFANSIVTY